MQKSPFCNAKRRSVHSHANTPNAATEWFHRKFGAAIQLSERRKNESDRKQKAHSYSDVKKNLENCLALRRRDQLERRYSFYNAENELFEDEGEKEEDELEDEEESGEEAEKEEGEEEAKGKQKDDDELADEQESGEEGEGKELEKEEVGEEGEKGQQEEDDELVGEDADKENGEAEALEEEMEAEKEPEEEDEREKAPSEDGRETDVDKEEEGKETFEEEEQEHDYEKEEDDELEDESKPEKEEVEDKEKDYESGEEGIELVRRKVLIVGEREEEAQLDDETIKRKLVDLFDDEASLSGDDVGSDSGDESQDGLDEYEAEEGDLDQLPDSEEIRENLVRQFLKHQNDDSDRQLLRLQEAFFADSDLHGQGGSGDRSFRFRMHADANVDWAKLLGTTDGDNEEDDGEEQREGEDEWHQRRLQMVKWRSEEEERKKRKRTREDEDGLSGGRDQNGRRDDGGMEAIAEPSELDAPLFTLGKRVLWAGSKGANAVVVPPSSSSLPPPPCALSAAVVPFAPPPKRRDSLLSSHRRSVAVTDPTVSSPSVDHLRLS